ncbi:MAG TPA: hypothetical protein VHH33_06505 [Nitrososphaeraceae archaeon]|jgi:hypothetical protein|nr:hypothetical protein [Nitrososphaeraceae archaeon]
MLGNNNKRDKVKKCFTLSEKEIENELSLIFEPQICTECGQDHSFKNSFEDVKTSMDNFPAYLRNRISIAIPADGGNLANTRKEVIRRK